MCSPVEHNGFFYLIFFLYKIVLWPFRRPSKNTTGKWFIFIVYLLFILSASLLCSLPLVSVETSWMATLLGKS